MNFIQKKIEKKIQECEILENTHELKLHQRVKLEYNFYLILGYLWFSNFDQLSNSKKKSVLNMLEKLMLGNIIKLITDLDLKKEFTTLIQQLQEYNTLRIESDGHGITYEDGIPNYLQEIRVIADKIESSNILLFSSDVQLIKVLRKKENSFVGKKFLASGESEIWTCPEQQFKFSLNHTYALILFPEKLIPQYIDLTPFIHIEDEDEFYIFQSVIQKSSGTVKYNRINKTSQKTIDWDTLAHLYQKYTDSSKKIVVSSNKTILNRFTPNYSGHSYINIGENRQKIVDFLTGSTSESSVCANMWGHGGVGKTATIQNVVLEFSEVSERAFNCIIFLSNKDRFYNIYEDSIEFIDKFERVTTFEELIVGINQVLTESDTAVSDENKIVKYNHGRMLIIIDDFETFEKDDQLKINGFIKSLNSRHHKVIITTRATIRIGTDDIIFNELNENDTVDFLISVQESKFPSADLEKFKRELTKNKTILHQVTLGKPLRIWQFALVYEQIRDLNKILTHFQNTKSTAQSDFFYGRYYDYFTQEAKDVFDVIGQLEYNDDLISSYDKVKFAVIWAEDSEDRFNSAISELKRLRVIEEIDDKLFKIWDRDILKGMKSTFQERDDSGYKGNVNNRIRQVNKKNLYDTDEALLSAAKENKELNKSQEEIKSGFKQIINRDSASVDIKIRALIELVNYYRLNRGSPELAFKELQNYERSFDKFTAFVRLYSLVCVEVDKIDKSVEVLSKFLSECKKNNINKEDYLEVTGLLITRIKTQLKKEFDENGNLEIHIKRTEDVIRKYAIPFFSEFKKTKFTNKGQRANAENGLRHLADLSIQVKNYNLASQICEYGINNFEHHFKSQFLKLSKEIPQTDRFPSNKTETTIADTISKDVLEKLQEIVEPQTKLISTKESVKEGYEYRGIIKKINFNNDGGLINCNLDKDVLFHQSKLKDCGIESLNMNATVLLKIFFENGRPSLTKQGIYKASEVKIISKD